MDSLLIMGDFSIHVNDKYPFSKAFFYLIDSTGFTQHVDVPTHLYGYMLDLVLKCGLSFSDLAISPHLPVLTDHYFFTFKARLLRPL